MGGLNTPLGQRPGEFQGFLKASRAAGLASRSLVRPDTHWNDTDGNRIEAHAAGMLQSPLDSRWYSIWPAWL